MLPTSAVTTPPGFFSFRWRPERGPHTFEDVAIVYKVPGSVDMAVLPDLFELVCRGPVVPQALVIVHIAGDHSLIEAMGEAAAQAAMLRFDGRLPLAVLEIDPKTFGRKLTLIRGDLSTKQRSGLSGKLGAVEEWLSAGLAAIFEREAILISAPAGFAFHKPSSKRSSYFLRADQALTTSAAVSFVALAILRRLLTTHGGIPSALKLIFVDTMSVASTAFALRELLANAGLSPLPQIESFHSYGGMNQVIEPLPGTSLCIISASSSMNLHRQWVEAKRVYDRDVLTLVTFEDAEGMRNALFALSASARPAEVGTTAKYDIRIAGENFFPVNEPPRKVLLTTTHHACARITSIYQELRELEVFDIFRASELSGTRRDFFIDGKRLMESSLFRQWVDWKLPQWLRAGTTQVIFQADESSRVLAQHIAHILVCLGAPPPKLLSSREVSATSVDPSGALVAVAAVVSRGNALLSLSRELRNIHRGTRLFVIGVQLAQSDGSIAIFDKNLKHSAFGALIDVVRMHTCLLGDALGDGIRNELTSIYSLQRPPFGPPALAVRAANLRKGATRDRAPFLLPTGEQLDIVLSLNEGFAFWPKPYSAGAFQAEILATVCSILQNARTCNEVAPDQRLRSPMLGQIALDPENFSRFNDAILQASLLRAALPSELDYRGDVDASNYMRILLERMASRVGANQQQPELEFLTALAIGQLRLTDSDHLDVIEAFDAACKGRDTRLAAAIRFLLKQLRPRRSRLMQSVF